MEKESGRVRDIAPTGVRMPGWLKEALQAAAKKEHRSLNAEILRRLERSLSEI